MMIAGYETHPVADVHRLLEGEELEALAASIKENGLREPIWRVWVDRGYGNGTRKPLILDGRNRLRACELAGVTPEFRDYDGPDDLESLLAFSRDLNESRRHDSVHQRAIAAARAKPLYEQAAKDRQGRRTDLGVSPTSGHMCPEVASRPQRARDEAGAHYGVSGRTVDHAEAVLKRGTPEVVQAVESGKLAVSAAAELAKLEPEKQREVMERAKPRADGEIKGGLIRAYVKQAEKAEVAKQLEAEAPMMPEGPFRVIVADPPWHYGKRVNDATHRGDLPYPSMTTEAICALPVEGVAHDDAILWLWTTNAHMRDAYDVIAAWGFEPKTILTWVKNRIGLGDWLRGQTEHCILAVRGKPVVTLTNQTTVIHGPVREHSRKPDEFYEMVEALCPGSKVEMFCRTPRDGWARWGAETEKFEVGT